jgi:energy-coupling factor transporter transmembrane protein EcfT
VTADAAFEKQGRERSGPIRWIRSGVIALCLVSTLPPLAVAFAAMIGLGLAQNVLPTLALLVGFVLTLLPALGLGVMLGNSSIMRIFALWVWALVLLVTLPTYFPGQRDDMTRNGLRFMTSSLERVDSEIIVEKGLELLALLGSEPPPPARAEKVASGGVSAKQDTSPLTPFARPPAEEPNTQEIPGPISRPTTTTIPYLGEGNSMRIGIHADGGEFGEEFKMIFDTGATLTTLNRRSLELLDVHIPPDAPTIVLHTAAGEMEASLALLDAIWLGGEVVEWVTVAVCEDCAEGGAAGLLGLNVSSHFRVSIDHEEGKIELTPRPGRRNRRLDIQPWLDLQATIRRWVDGRVEVEIEVENRSRREIRSALVEVKCIEERFTVTLESIPAHQTATTNAALPWGSDCAEFEVRPLSARWNLDRF